MTVVQMLNSLPVLQRVLELKLPIKKAHKIYSLTKQILEQRDFFINEEKKLIEKFNAEIVDNGGIKFNSPEDKQEFVKEHAELMCYEIDLDSIELSFDDLKDIEFTPKDIALLENVVIFVE